MQYLREYKKYSWAFFTINLLLLPCLLIAQKDTVPPKKSVFINSMMDMIRRDTTAPSPDKIRKNEEEFLPYSGYIVRNISIVRLPFGTSLRDTSKQVKTTLTRLANTIHHITRKKVIENNLFFHRYDTIKPYLFSDNERFLRELPYVREADLVVSRIGKTDSADITVIVKDVFSLGGSIGSLGLKKTDVELREDNISGSGNAAVLFALYDANRKNDFAFGGELIRRNIGGSFIDQRIGYQSYYSSLRAPRQENFFYYNLKKPLLNRYMNFTYELDGSYHATSNKYSGDSLYKADYRYRYYQFESWLGYNFASKSFSASEEKRKLRLLAGLRILTKKFTLRPGIYQSSYNWQFADLTAILGSMTFYRQNFFKARYIYGFGKTEDIPEGILLSLTGGHTIKQELSRPFLGINFQQYGFNKRNNYVDVTLRGEGYLGDNGIEDINLLASVNYFDKLKNINAKWTQRFFLNFSAARQINTVLNEPLFVTSTFGLPEFGKSFIGGDTRISGKAESVFFSPWALGGFRFAPILFANVTAFQPNKEHIRLYSSIGGGVRARNESLIFGTIEIKGIYFPGANYKGENFGLSLSTNLIFKYNSQFIKKPDFIQVN